MIDLTDFLNVVASAEDWAGFGADGREPPKEPMKRFTIDVPVELHRRVRAACARRGLRPSNVLRDLLEREFPETSGELVPVAACSPQPTGRPRRVIANLSQFISLL
jgi:hypothetical protein